MSLTIVFWLAHEVSQSIAKERRSRIESDLRVALEQFRREVQGAQGAALIANLPAHATLRRTVSPVIFPENFFQYFYREEDRRRKIVPLPSWSPNPSTCVRPDLVSVRRSEADAEPRIDDRELIVCSAVVPNGSYGQYIYITISANGPVPRASDAESLRDHFEVSIVDGSSRATFIVAFSTALTAGTSVPIYDLIPFIKDDAQGRFERIRKSISGQAFFQTDLARTAGPQRERGQLVALFRIARSSIVGPAPSASWPPTNRELRRIQIGVVYSQSEPTGARVTRYSTVGESVLSLPKVAQAAPERANISLIQDTDRGERVIWERGPVRQGAPDGKQSTIFEALGRLFRPLVLEGLGDIARPVIGEAKLAQVGNYRVRMAVSMDRELDELNPIIALFVLTSLLLMLAYLVVWFGVLRRVVVLYRRARQWGREGAAKVGVLSLTDRERRIVNSHDELGLLAREFTELIRSAVSEASDRSRKAWQDLQRADARRQVLRAVGHEIRSPLQALINMVEPSHESHKYLGRMKTAVESLLNANSPVDAFEAKRAVVQTDDLAAFCKSASENAPTAGFPNVRYLGPESGVLVEFDSELLELAITHILDNANRERSPGTEIRLILTFDDSYARLSIENEGPQISEDKLERIFEYGYTTRPDGLGQGLFVAKVTISKQGAELRVHNLPTGVVFIITFAVTKE